MKKFLLLTLTIVIGMLTGRVTAQELANYTFSTGTDASKWITLTTTTSIITPGAVDGRASALQEIGFPFMFGEDTYTQFSVNTDGNLRLGSTVTGTANYSTPFSSTNANVNNPKINFMGCDGYQTDSCYVYKQLTGTAPNRVLVVEFAMSTYISSSRPSLLRWQVQLFEGSNNIQIVYAPTTPPILPNATRQVGMCINANDVWLVDAAHQATYYTAGQSTTIVAGTWPDVNRYYLFTAPVVTCKRAYNVSAQFVNSSSATITWGSDNPSNNFILQVKPAAADWASSSVVTYQLTDTFCQCTGFMPNSSYNARVAVVCSAGDTSEWKETSFTTSCLEINTLPYSCDFETVEAAGSYPLPACWTKGPLHANYPYRSTTANNAYQGNGFLYFYSINTVALPPIDRTAVNLNNTQVSFYARGNGYVLQVGMMSNPYDANSFVQIFPDITLGNNYDKYEISLSSYTGTGSYVAFRNVANNYIYMDNVMIEEIPSCARPYPLAINDSLTTQTSLHLTWTERGTATEWLVEYGIAGFLPGTGTVVSATTPYMDFTNLSPSMSYDFYVRSLCASGDTSEYSNKCTGTTLCGMISNLPLSENFDVYSGAASVSANTVLPNCWNNYSTGNYSGYAGYPYMYNSSTYALSGSNALYFSSYKTSTTQYGGNEYAILPPIDTLLYPMNTIQVEFSARKHAMNTSDSYSYYYSFIMYVGVWADDSTFTPVDTIEIGSLDDINYHDYIVQFSNFTGHSNRVAFMIPAPQQVSYAESGYGTYYYNSGHVDDIILSVIPSCAKPFMVRAYDVKPYSVTTDWVPMGNETEWEVVAVPAGVNPDNGTAMQAYEHPFIYTGLNPATDYDVYVRSNCGSEYSPWSKKQSITTKCAPVTVPYVENFDSYGASTSTSSLSPGAFPTCWTALCNNASPYPYINSNYHSSGIGGLYFYGTSTLYSYAASQAIDVSQYPAGSLALQFKIMKTSASYGRLRVGVTTNPDNIDSMVVLRDYYPTDYENLNVWYPQMLVIPEHYDEPLYVVFYLPAGNTRYAMVDDVLLDVMPDCPAASNFTVNNVTGSSALLTWTASPYGALGYDIEYSELNQNAWSSIPVTGDYYLLSGLNPETQYEVRLYPMCSAGYADTLRAVFRTGCLSGLSEIQVGANTTTTYYVPTYASTSATSGYTLTQEMWLASELNNQPGDINAISLQYAGTVDTTRNYDIYMMHTLESTIPNTFMPITGAQLVYRGNIRWVTGGDGWHTILLDTVFHYNGIENLVITFDDNTGTVVGSTSTVKFYYTANASTTATNCHVVYKYLGTNIDPANPNTTGTRSTYRNNIRFSFACPSNVTCVSPNVLVSDVESSSITLDWVPGYTENEWEVQYKRSSETDYVSEGLVTVAPHTIYNLMPSQTYEVRMRSVCSAGDSSDWVSVIASTPCEDYNFPLQENFDSYPAATAATSGVIPTCWNRIYNYETYKPYISSAEKFSGTGSLRLYGTASYYGVVALPRFDASVLMDSIQVQFRALSANAGGTVLLGVMNDPSDLSTFVPTGSYTPSEVNVWEYAAINTSGYRGNGRYLAFMIPQDITSTFYIDDVNVHYIPNCLPVSNIQASNITTDEADITWTPGDAESSWNYFYGVSDSVNISMTYLAQPILSNNLHLTNLLPNTEYTIFVQASCDNGEMSGWMSFSFSTKCLPVHIPYYENFEGYYGVTSYTTEVLPDCWSRINTGTYSYYAGLPIIYGSSTYAQSGNNCLYFYSSQSMTTDYGNLYAILPEIDVNVTPIQSLQVSFGLRKYISSYDGIIVVGVMSDPALASTFVPVDTVQATNVTYSTVTVDLSSYAGTGKHIALYLDKNLSSSTTNAVIVDDIVVEPIPQCDAPTNLVISNVTLTGATLNWSAGGNETSWEVSVVLHDDPVITAVPQTATDSTMQISGLTSGTKYDVYVRAICPNNAGYSTYLLQTFMTMCDPLVQLPFEENFDSEAGISSASTTLNNLPTCWKYINEGTNTYSGLPYIYSSSEMAASGTNSLRFYTGTPTAYTSQYAILPQLDVQQYPINTLQLELDMRKTSTSYSFFALIVGVMSDPAEDSTFVPVDTLYSYNLDYANYFVYFDQYQGNGSYIALLASDQMGVTYNTGYVDNISLAPMASCLRVQNDLTASNITTESVTLSWTPTGTESSWIVEYSEADDTLWTTYNTTSIPVTIHNLTDNTNYVFRVKADCGSSVSSPSNPLTIITECFPRGIPFTENFDSYTDAPATATSNYLPSCWKYINTGSMSTYAGCPTMYSGSTYAHSGTISLKFFTGTASTYGYEYAILPALDTTQNPIQDLQLKFYAKKSSSTYNVFRLEVGIMSNPYDVATYTPFDTLDFTSDDYTLKTVYFRNYNGYGNYVVLKAVKEAGVAVNQGYVDDIEISLAPTCLPVRDNMSITNVTSNSANISWTPNGAETEWLLRYKPNQNDVAFDTVVVTGTHDYTLQNLTPNTLYAVQVLASCGYGEYATTWTAINFFTTSCTDITVLPYNENFESTTGTTTTSDHVLPDCWDYYNTGSSYSGMPQVYNSSTYALSGSNSLKFYTYNSSTYSDQYAILPGIDPTLYPMNTLQMRLASRRSSSTYNLMLIVGVMTDPSNINTFVPVDTINPTSTSYVNDTVRFANYTGTGKYIALKAPQVSGTNYNQGYVDNIVVEVAPVVCNAPTNVTASSIASTSATITWTPAGGESDWVLQYREPAGSWSSDINVTGTPSHNLTGLADSTQYEVHVKAVCDNTHSSDWSATATFTTQSSVTPPTVTTEAASNIGETTATLHGTVTAGSETITAQGFEWKATTGGSYTAVNATGTAMTYDLAGLTAGTGYTFRAFATTASGTTYGAEMTFTTEDQQQDTCAAPTNVTVSDITSNSALVSWTQQGDVTNWDVQYKQSADSSWSTATANTTTHTLTNLDPETNYEVRVIAHCSNDMTSDPSATVAFRTEPDGINGYTLDNSVVVYPNPTNGLVQIQNLELRIENLEVYDAYGKLLKVLNMNDNATAIDLSGYAAGTYFVKIMTENGVVTKRVVKQ